MFSRPACLLARSSSWKVPSVVSVLGRAAVFIIGNIITRSFLSPRPSHPSLDSWDLSWNGNHFSPLIITNTKLITTGNNFFSKIHFLGRKIFFWQRDWRTFDLSLAGTGWDLAGTWLGTSNSDIILNGREKAFIFNVT